MEVIGEKGPLEDYTQDGTVDLQGRPVLRSRTGRWKACSFLVGKKKSFTSLYKYLGK
jgi:peptide/histidine transporter 3/4